MLKEMIKDTDIKTWAIIILVVSCLILAFFTTRFFLLKGSAKRNQTALINKINELQLNNQRLKESLKSLEHLKNETSDEIRKYRQAVDQLRIELTEEKKRSDSFRKEKQEQINSLKATLLAYQNEKTELLGLIKSLNEALANLKQEYTELKLAREEADETIEKLNKKVEDILKSRDTTSLGTIIVQ